MFQDRPSEAPLSPAERAVVAVLAEIMIPGGEGMPSAGEVDVAGAGVDRVLRAEPRHLPPLRRFLACAAKVAVMPDLDAAARKDAEGFRALHVVAANAYFMSDPARHAIGYPGQQARDSSVDLGDDVRALLARVVERGPIWRA